MKEGPLCPRAPSICIHNTMYAYMHACMCIHIYIYTYVNLCICLFPLMYLDYAYSGAYGRPSGEQWLYIGASTSP